MHRRPTVDPRLLFRYSSSCSFTASAMTNVCCRKVASMVSTSESSESDESDSKNFSHGVNSIYTHAGASIYYTARENHKKGTNRWRVIPGRRRGWCARRWSIPAAATTGGRLFSPDPEGRCSGSAREGVGRPHGAIPPADTAGIAGGGRADARAGGGGRKGEKSAG